MSRASYGHDAYEVWDEIWIDMRFYLFNYLLNVAMRACIVVPQVSHKKGYIEIVVIETSQHCFRLFFADVALRSPVRVDVANPAKVIVGKRRSGGVEVFHQWISCFKQTLLIFRRKEAILEDKVKACVCTCFLSKGVVD